MNKKLIFGQKWPNLALKMNLTYFNQILILKILELVFTTNFSSKMTILFLVKNDRI